MVSFFYGNNDDNADGLCSVLGWPDCKERDQVIARPTGRPYKASDLAIPAFAG